MFLQIFGGAGGGGGGGQGAMEVLRPGAPRVKGDLFILA